MVMPKTSQNVPQEKKPENIRFLKNQFPVQFVGEKRKGIVLCVLVLLKYWTRSGSKVNNRSQYPMAALMSDFFSLFG